MSKVFLPYESKLRGKSAMQGRFFTAFGVSALPVIMISVFSLAVLLMPSVRESIELISSGIFSTKEAQLEHTTNTLNNLIYAISLIMALFNFLVIGGEKQSLDMIRGKDVKVRGIFCYYDKWYVAIVLPLISLVITILGNALTDLVGNININIDMTTLNEGLGESFNESMALYGQLFPEFFSPGGLNVLIADFIMLHFEVLLLFFTFKIAFVPYILADTGCKSFLKAFKKSWKMTNFKVILSIFLLYISFIGWMFISALTMGLALIYAYPYMKMSNAALYYNVKKYNRMQQKESEA